MTQWLTYFDSDGFEAFVDIKAKVEKEAWDLFVNDQRSESSINQVYSHMAMRARFNPQRSPEIWVFNSSEEIDEEALWSVADENPQFLADWIRKNGTLLNGDPKGVKKTKRIV